MCALSTHFSSYPSPLSSRRISANGIVSALDFVFLMDHLAHLGQSASAKTSKLPDTARIDDVDRLHLHRNCRASREQVEIRKLPKITLNIEPIGQVLGGIVHNENYWHWL